MKGQLGLLLKGTSVQVSGYKPSRPLGGWLCTYAKIGPNGGIIESHDRDDQVFEAAQALGRIDFNDYLRKGIWNDTHNIDPDSPPDKPRKLPMAMRVFVGVPTMLEFHDKESPLAKAHGKLGFWTEGHLFDRRDPRSWTEFTDYEPTEKDLLKADYYWRLAELLKGTPRPLGISADGKMLLSPCKKRIIWAKINEAAVCEVPVNPDATIEPLLLGRPWRINREMVGGNPCDTCSCPAGACRNLLLKGSDLSPAEMKRAPAGDVDTMKEEHPLAAKLERLIGLIMADRQVTRDVAAKWVKRWLKSKTSPLNAVPKDTATDPQQKLNSEAANA
tara:strand:- start:24996 stop:25988 length:993 start_codon:yes stop_codon:yes gene_type:complete